MNNQRISIPDDDHRVLQFRPRSAAHLPPPPDGVRPPATVLPIRTDFSPGAGDRDAASDDFRHRMLTNIAALGFTVALTVVGFWLATSIADLRRSQDCVLMGRRDCAHLPAPSG